MTYLKTTLSPIGEYTIFLNRPDKHHALNVGMLSELAQAFSEAFNDEMVHVIVIRSSGKVFCAGADLLAMQENPNDLVAQIIAMLKVLRNKNKPILVALAGSVYGGGSLLLGFADMIIAKASVSVVMPEIKSCLWPVFLMYVLKPYLPQNSLMHMAMTAEPLSAERAHALGWFSEVVADELQLNKKIDTVVNGYCQHPSMLLKAFYQCYKNDFNQVMSDEKLDQLGDKLIELVGIRKRSTV